jgi:hypothetical protein
MTENDLNVLDTIGTPEYLKGNLSDSGSSFSGELRSFCIEVSPHRRDGHPRAHGSAEP